MFFLAHPIEDCNVQSEFEELNLFLLFSLAAQVKISSLNFMLLTGTVFWFLKANIVVMLGSILIFKFDIFFMFILVFFLFQTKERWNL